MFRKKFDHSDLTNFLPDNHTIGTVHFFQKKYPLLDEHVCKLLEIDTRQEYDNEEEIKQMKEQIRLDKCNQDVKVMVEYKQIMFYGVHDELLSKFN
jgi:hypothetical protein